MKKIFVLNIICFLLLGLIIVQQSNTIKKLSATNQLFDKQIDSLIDDYDMLRTYSDGLAITLGQIKEKCGIVDTTGTR